MEIEGCPQNDPMDKLEQLDLKEMKVVNAVCSLTGTMEDKAKLILAQSFPQLYNEIFLEYSQLEASQEAQKRAIFLQWYSVSEPLAFTGIGNLDEPAQKNNVEECAGRSNQGRLILSFKPCCCIITK
jgi:hypothetical protein